MDRIAAIARRPSVRTALAGFQERLGEVLDLAVAIQQIPAPTFAEARRADFVEAHMRRLGLLDVGQDELHNVYGRLPGGRGETSPPVVVSAHLDTVFAAETDLSCRSEGTLIYGPGIGDNSTGVAGVLALAQMLRDLEPERPADVWFVANVAEEGLGDLRGMRAVVARFGSSATYLVVEGGLYGQVSHQGIGVQRFRIDITGRGGHSWGNFGVTSAIHVLGHLISAIDALETHESPKTTYNVGVIEGGRSVNTIADSAGMLLDLRSEDSAALSQLTASVERIVRQFNRQHAERATGITLTMTQVGDRPAGGIPRQSPLVRWTEAALHCVGCERVKFIASSTDANIPLSLGASAVCLGLTESGNSHRLDEYINISQLPAGLGQLLLVTLAAAGL